MRVLYNPDKALEYGYKTVYERWAETFEIDLRQPMEVVDTISSYYRVIPYSRNNWRGHGIKKGGVEVNKRFFDTVPDLESKLEDWL